MNKIKSHKYNTLTLIITLFFLILIPLISFCIYSLSVSISNMTEQTYNTLNENSLHIASSLDKNWEDLYKSNLPLVNQSNIQKLALISDQMSDYEIISSIKQLCEQMGSIRDASPFLSNMCIHFRNLEKTYNAKAYSKGSFQEFTQTEYEELLEHAFQGGVIDTTYHNDSSLSIYIPSPDNYHAFTLELVLNVNAIQSYLANSLCEIDDYYLYQLNDTNVTFSNMDDEIKSEILPYTSFDDYQNLPKKITIDHTDYFLLLCPLEYSDGILIRIVATEPLLAPVSTIYQLLLLFFIGISIGCICFFIGIYRLIHRPLKNLTTAFFKVENGDFSVQLNDSYCSDFSYLYYGFNQMTANLAHLIEHEYQQNILLQKAELKQLQSQINPHFLFNSFFLLQRMIKMELNEEANSMAESLGTYFQYITRNSNDTVLLSEEYEHAKIYADIQALRFEGRIEITIEALPLLYQRIMVPKMILQPVLENAFSYGLNNKEEDGLLLFRFETTDDGLHIIVEDNGDELTDEKIAELTEALKSASTSSAAQEMTGILNITRRLAIFSSQKSYLSVSRSSLGGLKTTIFISNNV